MTKITSKYNFGLSQDIAISKNDNNHIYSALNIDLVTDTGLSTGIISNHKGNKLEFNIPNINPFYSIVITGTTNSQVSINGNLVNISINSITTTKEVYNDLINDSAISLDIANGLYGIYYNSKEIVVQGYSINPIISIISGSLSVSTLVSNQNNLSIIGWGTLEEEIILLTTSSNNTSENPVNTAGQVWVLNYNDNDNSIIGLVGNTLNPSIHLKYNNILNFSLANEVYREAIGRKESSLRGNFYWTDNYNNPRVINIYNPQCAAIPIELLDWKPSVNLSTPIIEKVISGGLLYSGSYQVAYQLYSNDGAISIYSPTSTLVPLTDSLIQSNLYPDYQGNIPTTLTNKSIQVSINNIDLNYNFIKVVLIEYEIENVPVINYVYDVPITGSNMSFIISGGENKIAISIEEFVNPLIFFDRVKTFTQKKNRLYPANTRTKVFDIDYDARAYRFNSNQEALLFSRQGNSRLFDATVPSDITNLHSLSDNEDVANPYNDESGSVFGLIPGQTYDDWLNLYQYKFQQDGVTFGGEGLNVSYTFVTHSLRGDSVMDFNYSGLVVSNLKNYTLYNSPFINNNFTSSGSVNLGTPPLSGFDHPIDGWGGYKNPLKSTLYSGYARGEVYRFGVVFYNNKGEQSFVKWISDIKIPEPWEDSSLYSLSEYLDDTLGDKRVNTLSIGIEFTFSNLPANITGFKVVRVERKINDKTRLGQGALFGALRHGIQINNNTVPCLHAISFSNTESPQEVPLLYINNDFALSSGVIDAPAKHGSEVIGSAIDRVRKENSVGIIKSPDIDFNNYISNEATHIKILQSFSFGKVSPPSAPFVDSDTYYTGTFPVGSSKEWFNQGVCYWADYIAGNSIQSAAFFVKYVLPVAFGKNIVSIRNQQIVDIEGIVSSNFAPASMTGEDYHHIAINTKSSEKALSGFLTKSLFCDFIGNAGVLNSPLSTDSAIDWTTPQNFLDPYFRVVSLCRYNIGQYGGPWRASRFNNIYISASDFFPINIVAPVQSIEVYGGDTYTNYYDTTLSFFHWKEDYNFPNATSSQLGAIYTGTQSELTRMSALAIAFPVESTINTAYRNGVLWNNSQVFTSNPAAIANIAPGQGGSEFAKFLADDYAYNTAYSQQNNLKLYLPKPFNFETDELNYNWVWVSEGKLDREIVDYWRIYLVNNYLPLEAIYGPINKITNLKEKLIAFQDRAISQVSSQENTAISDSGTGAVYQIGTGSLLARYDYLSKEYGVFHQHSVVTGPGAIYSFDSRTKKFFKLEEGLQNISDVKGLSAYFRKKLNGFILNTDKVLKGNGIHGVYDTKYNKMYMTFINTIPINYTSSVINIDTQEILLENYSPSSVSVLEKDDLFYIGSNTYKVISINTTTLIVKVLNGSLNPLINKTPITYKFTIAFNEMLGSFESFYSFTPSLYLPTGKRLLSANPFDNNNSVYVHNEGDYSKFYDKNPSVSEVEFIVNFPDETKTPTLRIDTLEFWSEVFDSNGIDIPLETITGILLTNDYQSTESSLMLLTPQQNVVRRERTWRINMIRDYSTNLPVKPFLKDVYVKIKIFYNNQHNKKFNLNDFNTNITLSYH
jgi:hypothetical protein